MERRLFVWFVGFIGLGLAVFAGNRLAVYQVQAIGIPQVTVCHCPDGNPENCNTLNVGAPAAIAHLLNHENDYRGECEQPPEGVCEVQSWTCEECADPIVNTDHVCYEPQQAFCTENYDCGWRQVCEGDYCEEIFTCDCGQEPPPPVEEPQPHNPPTFAGSSTEGNQPVCNGVFVAPAVGGTGHRVDEDTVVMQWWPSTGQYDYQVLNYGFEKGNYPYNITVPFGQGIQDLNELFWSGHTWARVDTVAGLCVTKGEDFDP